MNRLMRAVRAARARSSPNRAAAVPARVRLGRCSERRVVRVARCAAVAGVGVLSSRVRCVRVAPGRWRSEEGGRPATAAAAMADACHARSARQDQST